VAFSLPLKTVLEMGKAPQNYLRTVRLYLPV
jgi:hypothetical protein